jgi:hypothetical protein
MDQTDLLDTGTLHSLHGSCPKFQIGIDGIFDEYGNSHSCKGIGYLLHTKGIYGGAGSDPQGIDLVGQRLFYLFGGGYLYHHGKTRL